MSVITNYKGKQKRRVLVVVFGSLAVLSEGYGQNSFPATGNVGIGTTSPTSPLMVVSQQTTSNAILGAFINPALPNGGLTQIQFGRSQADNADGTLIFVNNTGSPALSYVSLGTYAHSFTLNVTGSGNVGVGTSTPGTDLATLPSPPATGSHIFEINGDVAIAQKSGGQMYFQDGTVQTTAWNGVLTGGDYAESVNVSGLRGAYEPGDVLVINPTTAGEFLKSSKPYSTSVSGVFSTKPGIIGRRQRTDRTRMVDEVPMAMTGIVPTKVSAENGPIVLGDLLVTSSKPGFAMKATDRTRMTGAIIGKSLGRLEVGTGVIEAVITLQ